MIRCHGVAETEYGKLVAVFLARVLLGKENFRFWIFAAAHHIGRLGNVLEGNQEEIMT